MELAKREHRIDCILSNGRHIMHIMHDVVIVKQAPFIVKHGGIPCEMHI